MANRITSSSVLLFIILFLLLFFIDNTFRVNVVPATTLKCIDTTVPTTLPSPTSPTQTARAPKGELSPITFTPLFSMNKTTSDFKMLRNYCHFEKFAFVLFCKEGCPYTMYFDFCNKSSNIHFLLHLLTLNFQDGMQNILKLAKNV